MMFRFVTEGSEINPGISIDKQNYILFLMFATYRHRWCLRFRYRCIPNTPKRFIFRMRHWTLADDIRSAVFRHGRTFDGWKRGDVLR